MPGKCQIVACLLLLLAFPAVGDDIFPRPPELEPDIRFWRDVFTRYSSDEGILHDNRELAVVYERLDMPAELSRRERQRRVSARRSAIAAVLTTLASGKRENLSAEEARILALWPPDVSNATLRAAASRIRYQQGLADRFRAGLERSGRWRDYIEAELRQHGVPVELAALPHVESSYNPDARSHVGASGIWQFTRSTGRRFMRVDHVVDERNDPFAATRAAAQLLAYNYSLTGNWPMAITAYNHGLAGARRAMRRHGDDALVDILRNYRGRTFGFASRNFYVAFLAALDVHRDPHAWFEDLVFEPPLNYSEFTLPRWLPASAAAEALRQTPAELARHNPALQPIVWAGSKHLPRGFVLRLPADSVPAPLEQLLSAIDDSAWADRQLPDLFHTVQRGDTLSEIAETYDTRVSTLVALNNLGSRHRIRAGQRLRLPAAGPAPVAVAAVSAPPQPAPTVAAEPPADERVGGPSAESFLLREPEPAAIAALAGSAEAEPDDGGPTALLSDPSDYSVADDGTIEVQALETLGHYADWLGIRTQRLRDLNGLAFRTPVALGQRIRLDLSASDAATFEALRTEWHRRQQDAYFRGRLIDGVVEHVVERGESVWILSLRRYDVPIWLFRQYNPEVDLHNVQPGRRLRFPVLRERAPDA